VGANESCYVLAVQVHKIETESRETIDQIFIAATLITVLFKQLLICTALNIAVLGASHFRQ